MYLDRSDLLYLTLARAGGLPTHFRNAAEDFNDDLRHSRLRQAQLRAEALERRLHARAERRERRLRVLRQAVGRLLARSGQRLASAGLRLAGPQEPQVRGCG
ncbi:MAG: hypothetical protein WD100_06870 [Tistlia sp.]|uniref:hypothetical protein n=1 Tax=Tistlia sp. TaxID=3057121 RepID=UPI0034A1C2E1